MSDVRGKNISPMKLHDDLKSELILSIFYGDHTQGLVN